MRCCLFRFGLAGAQVDGHHYLVRLQATNSLVLDVSSPDAALDDDGGDALRRAPELKAVGKRSVSTAPR